MPQSSPTPAKIEQAIDALLRLIVANDTKRQNGAASPHTIDPADMESGELIDSDLDEIIADPIGCACRSEVMALGGLLFETLGTIDHLADVVERIAGLDQASKRQRGTILDECWQGIGSEDEAGWEDV